MPLVKATTGTVKGRVIGVWESNDQRIVEVMPGTRDGVAPGMLARFVLVQDGVSSYVGEPSTVIRATDRTATFATALTLGAILPDVEIS